MKYIEATDSFIIFCVGKSILVYENGHSEGKTIDLPSDDATSGNEAKAICIKLSSDEKYLAVACESKVVTVWCTQTWTLKYTHKLVKRPMSIDITSDSGVLLVADKTGDVYHFPLTGAGNLGGDSASTDSTSSEKKDSSDKAEPEALLGHLSMLLDLAITDDKRYVITCDRDEKIRTSRYPNSYNIESFCLGHTEFVTQIDILPCKEPILLSCSGDGTVRLWNYLNGESLATLSMQDYTGPYLCHFEEFCQQRIKDSEEAQRYLPDHPAVKNFSVHSTKDGSFVVAVVVDRIPALFLYKLEEKKLHHSSTTDTKGIIPLVVTWLRSGDLVVEQNSSDQPLSVYKLQQDNLTPLPEHPLVSFGQSHKESFNKGRKELSIDVLYKQRYDNMADYLKKKQERMETEKAVEAGLIPAVKKGRWL